MPKLVMLETKLGSPDGITVKEYKEGESYEVPLDLYRVFVEEIKVAEPYREKSLAPPVEEEAPTEEEAHMDEKNADTEEKPQTRRVEHAGGKQVDYDTKALKSPKNK